MSVNSKGILDLQELQNCDLHPRPTEDQSCVDRLLRASAVKVYPSVMVAAQNTPPMDITIPFVARGFALSNLAITNLQVCELLDVSPGTWRGWVSRGQAPKKDGDLDDRTPYWKLGTIVKYVQDAPGGRLGYPVG